MKSKINAYNMKHVLAFLSDLTLNNDRSWFQENKNRYDEIKKEHEVFLNTLIQAMSSIDPDLARLTAKDVVFRIYRDVRFSHDKSPYKTHVGAYLAKGGKKSSLAGYYIHLEPNNCFISGGLWCPETAVLRIVREDVYTNLDEFKAIVNHSTFSKYFKLEDDKLKKVPANFPKDSPDSEWVKYKSYLATCKLPDQFFEDSTLVEQSVKRMEALVPLVKFLNFSVTNHLD